MATKIPDNITLDELVRRAAISLTRAGMQHRIDIYRDVEVEDPAVKMMLGRTHRVRVRVKITAASLLFEPGELDAGEHAAPASESVPLTGGGTRSANGAPNGHAAESGRRVNGSHDGPAEFPASLSSLHA